MTEYGAIHPATMQAIIDAGRKGRVSYRNRAAVAKLTRELRQTLGLKITQALVRNVLRANAPKKVTATAPRVRRGKKPRT